MKKVYNLVCALCILMNIHASARNWGIEVGDFYFTPSSITVSSGDTITWVLVSGTHSIETLSEPAGAANFNSPLMTSIGQTFMFVPTVTGAYTYDCGIHGSIMTGSFTVQAPLGISEPNLSFLSKAYPNPFTDKITIDIRGVEQIDLFNLIGKRMKTINTSPADTRVELELSDLPVGIYFFSGYKDGKVVTTQKIMKVK